MMDNFFKNKLDESLLKHRIPYDERSWQIVASQLDAQQPKPKLISAWWLLLLLPLAGWNYALQMGLKQQQNSTTAPATAIQAPMVVRDTVYQVVYRNVYLSDKPGKATFASIPQTSAEAKVAQTFNLNAGFQGIAVPQSHGTLATIPGTAEAPGSTFSDGLSASKHIDEFPTALLPVRLHKIVEPKNGRSVHLQIGPFDEDARLIKPLVEKKRKHAADFESVRLSYQQSVPISPVNESTFAATLGYRLTPKIVIASGLQYQSASNAISNQELELYHHSPVLHQGGDELVDVVYWSSHFSAPLNLEYYFSTKSRFKPFVSIGGLFQNHLSTTLSYNIRTLSQEAYLIEKKILDRHWNSFLTFGVGLDLPLYQRILGFANVSIRKAVGGQFLLTNEKLVTNGTVGVKYKF